MVPKQGGFVTSLSQMCLDADRQGHEGKVRGAAYPGHHFSHLRALENERYDIHSAN